MKKILLLALGSIMIVGCAHPKKEVVVIHQNRLYKCESPKAIEKKIVMLINHARSQERYCGFKQCSVVASVRWNSKLAEAARIHSLDMAKNNFFNHKGSNGRMVKDRVDGVRYSWRAVGENILAGRQTCEDVVAGWLDSAGHCKNIMASDFIEIGAACTCNPSSKYGTYWTLVLASPR